MFKLDSSDLEMHILKEIEPIKEMVKSEQIHFYKNSSGSDEGIYIFSDLQGYHFVYSERGEETKHKVTDSLFEITFWVINHLVSSVALEMLKENVNKVKDQRQYIFEKKLELLEIVGTNYKKAGEIQISEILKDNPL